MAKDSAFVGAVNSSSVQTPAVPPKSTGAKRFNGESGYQKRTGGTRIDEVNRDLTDRFEKPTKK